MTVGELIALLTAQADELPDGLGSRMVAGVDDDGEKFAGVYTTLEVTTWPMPRRGNAVLVRGLSGPSQPTAAEPAV